MKSSTFWRAAAAATLLGASSASFAGTTVEAVMERGKIICGVHGSRAGFSRVDSTGSWTGMDVDTCRAVAAAVLGDASKVEFLKTTSQTRFPALQTGEVDMLANNVTQTLTRDTSLGFDFAPATFYDGQGFMVARSLGAKSVTDLNGATVCVAPGSTSEKVLADVFRQNNMKYTPVVIEKSQELSAAFFSGRCDVNVQSTSGLSSQRAIFAKNPDDWVLLPEVHGKDPMGPVVRHGDHQWKDIVTWVVYAMIEAEESGVTSENIDSMLDSDDPNIARLVGSNPGMGKALGLDEKWAYRVIKQVGNYGEMYDRNFGEKSVLKLPRKLNQLWTKGGLIYSPPFK